MQYIPEYEITAQNTTALATLLDNCFPDTFDGRTYFKQLPHFRYLAFDGETLIGQMGVDHRVIRVAGEIIKIFGIIDLCAAQTHRNAGIATKLLEQLEGLATPSNVDFLVLMGDIDTLYLKNGFQHVTPAPTKWLAIEDIETFSVIERDLSDCFLVKPLTNKHWPGGQIDMLGYLF
ncbi:acetyltransferase [Thalassospira sp. TSL5-1]|nr:acetyltransferase [Thalassospira sp. TSL5-1]